MNTTIAGTKCTGCRATEQRCALHYPCCTDCSHFADPEQPTSFAEDGRRHNGEDACGTEAGYLRHRRRREPACAQCRHAHNARSRGDRARAAADKLDRRATREVRRAAIWSAVADFHRQMRRAA